MSEDEQQFSTTGRGSFNKPGLPLDRVADDPVNHPRHYTQHPSGVECIDIVEHFTFCVGNTIKYCWRSGLKVLEGRSDHAARIEDLEKARWYLDREIARLKGARP